MNNSKQYSWWYKDYQICFYPQEQTLRCPDTYSQIVKIWSPNREIVYDNYFGTDGIFWSGVETTEKLQEYCKRVIDNLEEQSNE